MIWFGFFSKLLPKACKRNVRIMFRNVFVWLDEFSIHQLIVYRLCISPQNRQESSDIAILKVSSFFDTDHMVILGLSLILGI